MIDEFCGHGEGERSDLTVWAFGLELMMGVNGRILSRLSRL